MSNEELNKACSEAQGWRNPNKLLALYDEVLATEHVDAWVDAEDEFTYRVKDYQPTANTESGKAQCFDLMVKFGLFVYAKNSKDLNGNDIHSVENPETSKGSDDDVHGENLQRLICEAVALLSGEEE